MANAKRIFSSAMHQQIKACFDFEKNITPEITILDVEIPFTRPAQLASEIGDGTLQLNMGEMARVAGLSESAFYGHFKGITGTTPLQYQKDLRLLEARKLISTGAKRVTAAAQTVGYESATQFGREYARKFGASPRSYVGGVCVSA